jgi:glycosyltransferase involved in cell wall biosynthesis
MKIALIGTRGVPANYGGFETCVEEVGQRLVKKGHSVTVYCRKSYYSNRVKWYRGMRLIYLPNFGSKSLDTISHTFLSVSQAIFLGRYDIHMTFNAANSLFLYPLRILGKKFVINTDGLEWKRSKWGFWGRSFYKISEKLACLFADRLVSDSKGIQDYYRDIHSIDSTRIAYGAYIQHAKQPDKLFGLGLKPNDYFLQITRFEPENHPLLTIRAFNKLKTDKKLVIVGGTPYPGEYIKQMTAEAKKDVILPGFIYEKEVLKELWCFCYAYIHGNGVGGTNPALLQTMASGCFTIAIDNPFNRDVLDDCGIYYQENEESLVEKMRWALDHNSSLGAFKEKAQARIMEQYSWEKVTDQYDKLFYSIYNGRYS